MSKASGELTAERLQLRALTATEVVALAHDPDAFATGLGLSCAADWPAPVVRQRLAEGVVGEAADPRFGVWVVIELSARTLIGDVGFHGPPDAAGSVEVGYALAPEWRGRGYATEAVGRLVDWAQAQDEVREVTARTRPENDASARVLERLGFERVGSSEGYDLWRRG